MEPVAAVMTVFGIVFAALGWLRLLAVCFREHPALGLVAVLLPPLALVFMAPRWREERELFLLVLAAVIFSSIAIVF
ncbi:hypothetical protein [Microbulbifer yueqingensis]|uniref:Uncharacterized protein n=1 Tax=Microbulbifer yueqingensis TaxID=658219 RepID=A0A1G9BD38_9GAMM|nr:hypothetical protein [Microbulbifer yueqingensis]SDK37458.1 hypothetical protein SAMN05216212_2200 [Microbulbifer yueqingensis]